MSEQGFSKTLSFFRKFGGIRLLRGYLKLGLGRELLSFLFRWVRGVPVKEAYAELQRTVIPVLTRRYKKELVEGLKKYEGGESVSQRSNIVWFCWFQGISKAPPIIKACYESLKLNLKGKEIRIVDESNRRGYAPMPDFIEHKWRKKLIPPAAFSDLLRLELLIRHGGTWIDSTVLCISDKFPKEMLDTDLFFFQFKQEHELGFRGISSWFITAKANSPVLMTLRDMLYAYWKDFDCVLEYFLFHRFMDAIAKSRPECFASMPYAYSPYALALRRHWSDSFDNDMWDRLMARSPFNKLTYKYTEEVSSNPGNYYNHILKLYDVSDVK